MAESRNSNVSPVQSLDIDLIIWILLLQVLYTLYNVTLYYYINLYEISYISIIFGYFIHFSISSVFYSFLRL